MGERRRSDLEPAGPRSRPEAGARRAAIGEPDPWELKLLRLLAEQAAIPFDQLASFLACEPAQAARVAKHLTKLGYTDYGRSLADEPRWLWLTRRGARLSGTGFRPKPPRPGAMARMRALNEVRLYIGRCAPETRWISDRSVFRESGKSGRRPNAVVEIGEERHAILVKPGRPRPPELEVARLETHMARYEAVVCFADPRPLAQLKRLQGNHHWPKLVLREIPKPPKRTDPRVETSCCHERRSPLADLPDPGGPVVGG